MSNLHNLRILHLVQTSAHTSAGTVIQGLSTMLDQSSGVSPLHQKGGEKVHINVRGAYRK